ncbi:MAG: sigma-54-dependent Fis family transcriptional regulator [Calditrichia bacterium]|nr:sigma-54-dependent Fis family transcriptional regulator [Calditrichia bacterium]
MENSNEKYIKLKNDIGLFGSSPEIEEIIRIIQMVAPTDLSVLINGESGTGKELVAKAIHKLSKRSKQTLISVNTGAIPEGILESELFGHEKGSFTGATGQKKGYFEAADKGTIFLDEIGEMSLKTQVKLLRVLEESEFMRVGATSTQKVDVRLIAATNKNLEIAVKEKEFRQDLYYRLKAVTINIQPLRSRKEDISILVSKFRDDFVKSQNITVKGFSPEALQLLKEYSWTGNVRELRNFVETALILNKGQVVNSNYVRNNLNLGEETPTSHNLPVPLNLPREQAEREIIYRTLLSLKMDVNEIKDFLFTRNQNTFTQSDYELPVNNFDNDSNELKPTTMAGMERELIKQTLIKFSGSRRKTARALQISERTLYRKIKEYGL